DRRALDDLEIGDGVGDADLDSRLDEIRRSLRGRAGVELLQVGHRVSDVDVTLLQPVGPGEVRQRLELRGARARGHVSTKLANFGNAIVVRGFVRRLAD